ncbi:MAG: LysE family translocator [Rhodobacteraceae bacterium]|jgi:threonine/homoserine/homoserine lactone efflux protein|uniref:Putative threonine efflux protein n=1 Tax=Salipiger profundus TaxID=1229727 RepID=A0A1U7D2H1_9RHOB|nr:MULTISPECIES: LysE family translocator [Salipiger]APX22341.1 putative threonine efflux protein [Salipiger profundus]MAB05627.1 LysE family translocator [Paracoccaceae bacterium]GGA22535.1 amino acid transporter LysE [Salipiger profundus]SFD66494.1 Threonine/homoserine/homoserine lactone efflux protein [Salipiger profundus]
MTLDLLLALSAFALVTVITPGPNNLMLLASGANFGLRRSVPHMMGIGLGFPLMVLLVGLGVMQVFERWPAVRTVLLAVSAVYMLWLAWKIAHAAPPEESRAEGGRPLGFLQAAAFQWVNPKAWTMALGAITLYAASRDLPSVLWVAGVYVVMSVISTTFWTVLGREARRVLDRPRRLRVFNWTMAVLLVASLLPALVG